VSSCPYAVSDGEGFGLPLGAPLAVGVADGPDDGFVLAVGAGVGVALGVVLWLAAVPGGLMHHDVFVTFVVIDLYAACAAA